MQNTPYSPEHKIRIVTAASLRHNAELQHFLQLWPILRVWVYGSHPHGDTHPNSDLDLLVEPDYTQTITLFTLAEWQQSLETLLHLPVDIALMEGISPHILPLNDQQLIYERG